MKAIEKINALLLQQGKTGAEMSRDLGLSNSAYSYLQRKCRHCPVTGLSGGSIIFGGSI